MSLLNIGFLENTIVQSYLSILKVIGYKRFSSLQKYILWGSDSMREQEFMINIRTVINSSGNISILEENVDFPFEIKRVYYIHNVPVETIRGMHAHKSLQQVLWCPSGEIEVILDDGKEKTSYLLDSPEKGLLVLKGYWHEMIWKTSDSVLCVAASDFFDEEDYIREYNIFIEYVKEGYWDEEQRIIC